MVLMANAIVPKPIDSTDRNRNFEASPKILIKFIFIVCVCSFFGLPWLLKQISAHNQAIERVIKDEQKKANENLLLQVDFDGFFLEILVEFM